MFIDGTDYQKGSSAIRILTSLHILVGELTRKLAIGQNLSTAFHPQTDGLSERKNQWIEQYLQAVTEGRPEQWNEWLALASTVHNNQTNLTI